MSVSSVSAADLPGLDPADDFSFREGQRAFLAKLAKAYQEDRTDHLGVFVPGYGKTLTALASFAVARAMGVCDKLVVFVPRSNLQEQYADADEMARMLRWIGAPRMPFCVADSDRVFVKNPDIPIVIATYQYACGQSGNSDLQRYCRQGSPLFVLDEIHHLPEEGTWSQAVGRLPYDSLIGLSGTPLRSDGQPLFGVPHDVEVTDSGQEQLHYRALHEVSLRDAHAEGQILKRIEAHVIDYTITMVEEDTGEEVEVSLAELKDEVGRDTAHLDRYFARRSLRFHDVYLDTLLGPAVGRLQEKRARHIGSGSGRNHQMLVTCMSNRHAADVLDFMQRRYGWLSATRIGQDVPRDEREERLEAYRQGEVDVMVQVDMIGEGTDIKTISVIAKLDLVSARSKTLQQIFRGMRFFDDWDEKANVCDVFTSGDLGLSETLDWMTREVKAGLQRRTEEGTAPEKAEQNDEASEWALTGVNEGEIETHRLELEDSRSNANLQVKRQPFEAPDPDTLDVSAREEELRQECSELATQVAYALQNRGMDVHMRDVHAKAKDRFRKAQSDMSLDQLKRKKQWLQRCLRSRRLV
jgi:superfamily II DNA or RNA helicase